MIPSELIPRVFAFVVFTGITLVGLLWGAETLYANAESGALGIAILLLLNGVGGLLWLLIDAAVRLRQRPAPDGSSQGDHSGSA
jgi:hypothetical protein